MNEESCLRCGEPVNTDNVKESNDSFILCEAGLFPDDGPVYEFAEPVTMARRYIWCSRDHFLLWVWAAAEFETSYIGD